ncbi:putative acyl protein synthase/acyl-CoA reductase-like protein [Pedosphaera parvula]|uniref:Putative acyl protein synthase/acyl-CoA reductase-like protein n=1 Tax=Pedosphaera parvula (strain Ellin514) TaxID=320771 RepID=B9XN04_PEDPL|nr:putative acyl protein synthase/acyl-CoA reductase-like protein [Pedosphaera parvula]EEF58800.1 putative acyl protein synthase/acyl-CoA reductase-like protein [Pedosphaera parvula Ellin514]
MNHNTTFSDYVVRLRGFIRYCATADEALESLGGELEASFQQFAMELFALQFVQVPAYRKFCEARKVTPEIVRQWQDIPAMPTAGFKELELTSIPSEERVRVFHSSGTTEQRPSRHFHSEESISGYESSLIPAFKAHLLPEEDGAELELIVLTPPPHLVPNSSLVHMFETVGREFGFRSSYFTGEIGLDGAWSLEVEKTRGLLNEAIMANRPVLLLGTAFSFVHLVDGLGERNITLKLPVGSRVMETGGYKGRSRSMPKEELHRLISKYLHVPAERIVCEYGMSELSSQAYDLRVPGAKSQVQSLRRVFHFPPWTRVQIVSPETGREVKEGETGLIRIFDLANVRSVMAIQAEDLGVRRGDGFELIGRAAMAESRGCSLMSL